MQVDQGPGGKIVLSQSFCRPDHGQQFQKREVNVDGAQQSSMSIVTWPATADPGRGPGVQTCTAGPGGSLIQTVGLDITDEDAAERCVGAAAAPRPITCAERTSDDHSHDQPNRPADEQCLNSSRAAPDARRQASAGDV